MTTPVVAPTNAELARKAVIDRLKEEAESGLFGEIDISYAWNGRAGPRSIYGGGWRFTQDEKGAERRGLLVSEIVTFALYVRVVARPAVDVEETDADAFNIARLISTTFAANPKLAGNLTWLGIPSGQGDYSRTDDETTSTHAYQVQVESYLSWGG